jgi:hypothetical protein
MDTALTGFINYNQTNSPLYSGFVSFLYRDGTRMWIANYGYNLFLHDPDLWASISWLTDYTIYGLYREGDELWIATRYSGIFRHNLSTGTYEQYNEYNVLPSHYILRITGDGDGNIYAGTGFDGALKFDGTNWTNYTTFNSPLPSNSVYSVACDQSGNTWFGTFGGLARLSSSGTWTVYDSAQSNLPSNYIRTIVCHDSLVVVATGFGGLGILNTNTDAWTVFNTNNSNIPSNMAWDVAVSDSSDIWIVFLESGVARLADYLPLSSCEVPQDRGLKIYPNPTDALVTVEYDGAKPGPYMISLSTIGGKTLLQCPGTTDNGLIRETLNIDHIVSGNYFISIIGNELRTAKQVVIRQK